MTRETIYWLPILKLSMYDCDEWMCDLYYKMFQIYKLSFYNIENAKMLMLYQSYDGLIAEC